MGHRKRDQPPPGKGRWVGVNEAGQRVGEWHGRAVLTEHDVENVRLLLDEREALLRRCRVEGLRPEVVLFEARLSFRMIARAMEVSESNIRAIATGKTRLQSPVRWVKVP